MSLIQQLKQAQDFTEREKDIARFVLEHPETIENMSSRELGHQTFTSAASVTRFCQKLGVKGFPEFKIKFVSELRDGYLDEKQEKIMSWVTIAVFAILILFGVRAGKCCDYGSENHRNSETGGNGDTKGSFV